MIERYRYDTHPITFALVGSDGAAIDVTGDSFALTVDKRSRPTDGSTEVASIAGVVDSGASGYISFTPSAPQADIEPRTYHYQIRRTTASGNVQTIDAGEYRVRSSIPA